MSASKKVVFYADLSENRKRLNFATDIVLTLSPADADSLPKNANPLVWKIHNSVIWYQEAGFSLVVENEDGTLSMRTQTQIVEPKHMTSFDEGGSGLSWSTPEKEHNTPTIIAFNNSITSKPFSLCTCLYLNFKLIILMPCPLGSVDNSQDPPIFLPSLLLREWQDKAECQTPMILQAYAVKGYQPTQPFKAPAKEYFLLRDHKNAPKPLNMEEAEKTTVFHLYSHTSGRPVVEKVRG
ncbi:hypothetical protein B0H14DRAFT_2925138 [Mycena olivaceomarginata]|nr:hypothetical protein B0H14DRAFT_2925138 [Mycena olivaceomarginata]